jgi:hypothetical protein
MGQKIASLEIELAMTTGGAVSDLNRFGGVVDKVTAQAIRDLDRIDAATKGVGDMSAATASAVAFAEQTARSAISAARELNRVEKAGESMVAQLDRQTAAFGKTASEIRAVKAETAALNAERVGALELAGRIRSAERALYDKEYAAGRRAGIDAEAAAEERAAAAAQQAEQAAQERAAAEARVNAQLMERAKLEGLLERNFGVGRPSAIQSGATFSALAERERELELAERGAAAERELIAAQRQQNNLLAERANLQAAIERNTGVGGPRAIDNGATYSALAARAAEDEARATRVAAESADRLAREHAELAAKVRDSQAAMEADAAAAERMRMATDPLYAATNRLNAEIAESTRLYHNGATAPAEYARQQEVLAGRMRDVGREQEVVGRGFGGVSTRGKLASHDMLNLAYNFQDLGVQMVAAAGSSNPMKMALMAMMQQGSQISGVMMSAGVGVRAVGAAFLGMSKTILLATVTNPILLGIAAAIGTFAGAVALLNKTANDGASMKEYARSLGLTTKEIRNLDNVTVTWGDTAKAVFQVAGAAIWSQVGPAVNGVWKTMKEWLDWLGSGVKTAVNFTIAAFVGGYAAIKATWATMPAAMGDIFYSTVNVSIEAINTLIRKGVDGINTFIGGANAVLDKVGLHLPEVNAGQIAKVNNQYAGAAAKVGKTIHDEVMKAAKVDYVGAVGGAIVDQARKNAQKRIHDDAEKKGYLDPEKGKTDKHAEQLAREAEAVEAQIKNLYALADAYGVSGAAALIAEARVKAESAAIKKRADIEELVARQVRLSIAERVKSAAQATAAMREQAEMQERVNAEVAAGTIPAARAADILRDRVADLPLVAALEAARMVKDVKGAEAAAGALDKQRAARDRLTAAERDAQQMAATREGDNQLARLREELRLVGATNAERVHSLAILQATQDAAGKGWTGVKASDWIAQQGEIALAQDTVAAAQERFNNLLPDSEEAVKRYASAFGSAFGDIGSSIAAVTAALIDHGAVQRKIANQRKEDLARAGRNEALHAQAEIRYAKASAQNQVGAYADITGAAKGMFDERSRIYKALQTAETVFRTVQLAMSVQAMVQNAVETAGVVTNAAAKATAEGTAGIAKQSQLTFPYNIVAMAATGAALVAAGIAVIGGGGGGSHPAPVTNTGTGTVLGDRDAKSESIKNAIDALADVDTLTNTYARNMAASLRSIDSQIGGVAALVVRAGNVDASGGVTEGFKMNGIGSVLSKIPLIGGILGGLFGSKTTVIGSGLYGGAQSVGSIVNSGFDASYYSDIEKKKKFLGVTTGTKYSTQYTGADAGLENQFTLILRDFNNAILAAAGPLGTATDQVQARLNGFIVNIGKIDLKGLSGTEIQEKLTAVFGAAADGMAGAAFPGIERFQKVGEGLFETLVRVASTVEAVGASLDMLGTNAQSMSIDVKLGLADQFDSVADLTSAAEAYFQGFYSAEEQAAAKTSQMTRVFDSLGLAMPASLAGFRQLVEAQNLSTAAGQATYATLLQLAPAFADLKEAMDGAKSAADIMSERQDLERQLLELRGDTAAIRAAELAGLDESNRALQLQIYALQDAQKAAAAADELRKAWSSVGDSIMDEVNRIRGLSAANSGGTYATLLGQFNAANSAARAGDMDAAKELPQLSKSLLDAAKLAATSRQELDRIEAQAAAALEATYAAISGLGAEPAKPSTATLDTLAASQSTVSSAPNADLSAEIKALREEVAAMHKDNNAGHATTAGNTGRSARVLESVTTTSGGDAISVASAA